MERAVFVYTTFPSIVEAEKAGNALVADRLAACVNILPGMISVFRWQGAVERAEETVMIIKTRASLAEQERKMISERIKAALTVARSKGRKFGLETCSKAERRRVLALSHAAMQKATMARAEARRLQIEWAFRQPSLHGGRKTDFAQRCGRKAQRSKC